jgi:hypothetical protein
MTVYWDPARRTGNTSWPSAVANTSRPPWYSLSSFNGICIVLSEKSQWKLIQPCGRRVAETLRSTARTAKRGLSGVTELNVSSIFETHSSPTSSRSRSRLKSSLKSPPAPLSRERSSSDLSSCLGPSCNRPSAGENAAKRPAGASRVSALPTRACATHRCTMCGAGMPWWETAGVTAGTDCRNAAPGTNRSAVTNAPMSSRESRRLLRTTVGGDGTRRLLRRPSGGDGRSKGS